MHEKHQEIMYRMCVFSLTYDRITFVLQVGDNLAHHYIFICVTLSYVLSGNSFVISPFIPLAFLSYPVYTEKMIRFYFSINSRSSFICACLAM